MPSDIPPPIAPSEPTPSFRQALAVWAKIGCLNFGGPAGQIALMQKILVDEKRWIDDQRFLHALNFCMLLPGPEAQQLATYCGWSLHGVRGGLAAGLLFILPGAVLMLALSLLYVTVGQTSLAAAVLLGVKAVVVAIVLEALARVSKRALKARWHWLVAAIAFIALFAFHVPFPVVVLIAGLYGFWQARKPDTRAAAAVPMGPSRPWTTAALGTLIWLAPLIACAVILGADHRLTEIGRFFATMAVVTFGGAYAVLAYVAQEAVNAHGWLSAQQMITGLGLAETTPGPLILVLQFVGFLAGHGQPAPFGPIGAGIAASALTLWVTFVPSFVFIFVGAPYMERLRANPRLSGALSAITAAVVGVILSLSLWFALHVLFTDVGTQRWGPVQLPWPDLASLDWRAAVIAVAAAAAMLRFHAPLLWTLAAGAAAGVLLSLI